MPVRNEYGMKEYRIGLASTRYRHKNHLNTVRNEYGTPAGLIWIRHRVNTRIRYDFIPLATREYSTRFTLSIVTCMVNRTLQKFKMRFSSLFHILTLCSLAIQINITFILQAITSYRRKKEKIYQLLNKSSLISRGRPKKRNIRRARRFSVRPGRTSTWWRNFVNNVVILAGAPEGSRSGGGSPMKRSRAPKAR